MGIKERVGLGVGIIHNNNKARNDYLFPVVNELCEKLTLSFLVEKFLISYQVSLEGKVKYLNLYAKIKITIVQLAWNKYLNIGFFKSLISNTKIILRNLYGFLKHIFNDLRIQRDNAVERVITGKHIRCWISFLEKDLDFLICFEDDVIFREDSIEKLDKKINLISKDSFNKMVYVDIGGGYSTYDLNISQLQVNGYDDKFIYFSRPVSNTACAYIVNRAIVEKFVYFLSLSPSDALLPIDWLINKYFILLRSESVEILCAHAVPSLVIHGSMNGHYENWRYIA